MSAVLLRGVSLAAALALILGAAGPVEAARRGSANAGRQAETPMTDPQRAEEPGPLQIPDSQLEPIDFAELPDWAGDDHASAFAAFLASCRPIVRTTAPDARPVLPALVSVCRRALAAAKSLQGDGDKARL
ncbi:MAG: hypothetical protein ACXW3G_03415, partial [Rhodoplanes sp.]